MFKPEYNISQVAGAPMFGRNHSEKTRAKMSAFWLAKTSSEETRAKISASLKGISLSDEHKAKISAYMMGNKNHNSISNLTLGRRKMIKISVLDLETNISTVYNSIGAAAKALNIPQAIISQFFIKNQKKPYKKRYVFRKC
jgi:group I intron endonuclease